MSIASLTTVGSNSEGEGLLRHVNTTSTKAKTVDRVVKIIPEFSGGVNEDLVFFTNACDLVAEITPESDVDIMLRTIVTKLRGQAYEVIKYETMSSLGALKNVLNNAFEKPKNVAYLQVELFSAKQNYKESVIEYVNRLHNLLKEVCDGRTQGKSKSDALIISNNLRE